MIHSAPLARRRFLRQLGLSGPAFIVIGVELPTRSVPEPQSTLAINHQELNADVIIIGGGLGGCAAALAAARNGVHVILTEETNWLGGQLTAQAVPPDENPWVETFGATRSYQSLRRGIRDYY